MIECSVDFLVDDRRTSIVPFLERLKPIVGDPGGEPWSIDLRRCQYLGPDAATILFALVAQARIAGRPWQVLLPQGPPALVGFCAFSGLSCEIDGTPEPHPELAEVETTMRLKRFMRATWNVPDPLVRLVRRHFALSVDSEEYLRTCVNEVLQNIVDHSQSPVGGVMCARYMAGTHQVRVAVVDRGRGILGTLRGRYPELHSDAEALSRVSQGGYTSKSTPRNLGVGLRNLTMFATAQGGHVTMVSGSGVLEQRAGETRPRVATMASNFAGTAVFFTLSVNIDSDHEHAHAG